MATELTTKMTIEEIREKLAVIIEEGELSPEKDKQKIADRIGIPLEELKEMFTRDRQERLLKKAELTSESLLDIDLNAKDIEQKYGRNKVQVMKLMQAEAQFIRETLGKDLGYSKRNEITGKNGEEIRIKEIIFNAPVIPNAKND